MLSKVISGGQDGVDSVALSVAKKLKLQTGGYMPKGALTESGSNKSRLTRFGMKETSTASYPARTRKNIQSSDGTVIFGKTTGRGTSLTKKIANQTNKPLLINPKSPYELNNFLKKHNIKTLNVAGTRKSHDKTGKYTKNVKNILGKI